MKTFAEKKCVICDKMFTPKTDTHMACSEECITKRKAKFAAQKRLEKRLAAGKPPPKPRAKKQLRTYTCIICGEEFTSSRLDRKTCSSECFQAIPERQKQESWERLINRTPIPEWLSNLETTEAARLRETLQRSVML